MLARLSIVMLLGLSGTAFAADTSDDLPDFSKPVGEAVAPAPALRSYDLDTAIQLLASNPATCAILEENIPGLLENSSYPFFKGMSLNTVASFSRGQITDQMLETIAGKLKTVPVSIASN